MEKEFIPYEQALALKDLEFDEPCFGLYGKSEGTLFKVISEKFDDVDDLHFIKAPTYQQVFRWFREKGIQNVIMPKTTPSNAVVYYRFEGKVKNNWDNCFETYEEAQLECLKKLIEIVKENGKNV